VLVAIFNNQFATTSEVPRRLMVTLIVYFVILINVAKGLRQVEPTHLELLRSYAASPVQVLRKARIPNAVPYLFTALKIAAPLAVITAFVAEYFGGPQNGLGSRITATVSGSRAAMWAYVLAAVLLGLLFYVVSVILEYVITQHWAAGPRGEHP
jgi:NitT/TauT family transport system permease protein